MIKKYLLGRILPRLVILALPSFSLLSAETLPDLPQEPMASIREAELLMHLEFLASEELGGRYTLSRELGIVNRYLASRLRFYGYRGAIDEDFLQQYEVRRTRPNSDGSLLTLTVGGAAKEFKLGDFIAQGPASEASGEVVFAGFGIRAPEAGRDDFAGIDAKGRWLFVLPGTPSGLEGHPQADDGARLSAAKEAGAVGVLTIPPPRMRRFIGNAMFSRFATRERVELAASRGGDLMAVMLLPAAADLLLGQFGQSIETIYDRLEEGETFAGAAVTASASVRHSLDEEIHKAANVVGILEGTDPQLRGQYVALSAHQDHLMRNEDGQAYPGADDDGSGVSALLGIARAYALQPPRRSILIIFHSGEENGLLGSRYNTEVAPAVPLDRIVVDLNIDMIGRSLREGAESNPRNRHLTDGNTVHVIGADRISQELNRLNEQTNAELEKLNFDYTFNDPSRPERYYFRSDHWNYARNGIPIIFFFTGTHEDYHRPSDTLDKIDFAKMTRIARHVYAVGWRLANLDRRVAVDAETGGER